ncbi:hypothetical protein [Caudoviricetes sp.]|nr:hypothetical protein [Caudoviricetes sp.]
MQQVGKEFLFCLLQERGHPQKVAFFVQHNSMNLQVVLLTEC